MTAPAVVQAPLIGAAPSSATEQLRQDDVAFMQQFGMGDLIPKPAEPVAEVPKAEEKKAESDEPAKAETPPAEAAIPAPDKPAEKPAEETVAEVAKRDLAVQFKAFDKEGELEAQSVADVEVEFTADGKERRMPIDKALRLAAMGFYNEKREQQVVESRQQVTQLTERVQSFETAFTRLAGDLEAMYGDETDSLYIAARDAYRQQNTPEAQLKREREKNEQLTNQQRQREEAQRYQAVNGTLATKIAGLMEKHPEVPLAEVVGQLELITSHLKRGGRVPPEHFAAYEQLVDSELTPWVQHTHESRSETKKTAAKVAEQREKTAKTQVHLAKRQLARTMPSASTPTGTSAAEPPKPKTYQKATDILADIENLVRLG